MSACAARDRASEKLPSTSTFGIRPLPDCSAAEAAIFSHRSSFFCRLFSSGRLIRYGFFGAVILSVLVILASPLYVQIYQVDATVKLLTRQILLAYALIAPFKVLNMIAGGGIIRSGGKTNYVMVIDMIGTWVFGVPLGLLSAFVWKLSIPYVYFILSLEECVRFAITVFVLRGKRWMQSLEG